MKSNSIKVLMRYFSVFMLLCYCLVGTAGCSKASSTEYDVIKQTKRENFTLLNQTAEKGQFVLIGDSIVELFPEEIFLSSGVVAYNRGISGDTSDRLLDRIEDNALSTDPSKIFILIGTNDIGLGISESVILNNISAIVDKCAEKGVEKIIVSALLPVNHSINKQMVGARTNEKIRSLNTKLSELCIEKTVTYADMFSALTDENGNFKADWTYDGLHPNAKGFLVMAEVLETLA